MGKVFDEITGRFDPDGHRPIWMMRQAGRYLPEYKAVRAKFPSFLDFCYTPDAATEVTLQPIHRFGFDAAIIFSDILVIPQALGQEVWFVTGEGPKLGPLPSLDQMEQRLASGDAIAHLAKVYQAIRQTRRALPDNSDLFGFAGAPWTLATYMIEGGSSNSYAKALEYARVRPTDFARLLGILQILVRDHLLAQVNAGANLLQLFDSWAGGIPTATARKAWSFDPLMQLAAQVATAAPVLLFAKGLSMPFAQQCRDGLTGIAERAAIAVEQQQPLTAVRHVLGQGFCTQGNIDPLLMAGDWPALAGATRTLLDSLASHERHIVNLGHGITPQGEAENVRRWVDLVKESKR